MRAMKKWKTPEVEELSISCTEQGKNLSSQYDEIRVDQNGNYWVSFSSGFDSTPHIDGDVTVH